MDFECSKPGFTCLIESLFKMPSDLRPKGSAPASWRLTTSPYWRKLMVLKVKGWFLFEFVGRMSNGVLLSSLRF